MSIESSALVEGMHLEEQIEKLGGPKWLTKLRQESAKLVADEGLPGPKTEAWRFTSLRTLLKQTFKPTLGSSDDAACRAWADAQLGSDETCRVYLVNGRLLAPAQLPEGVSLASYAELAKSNSDDLAAALYEAPLSKHFYALNRALFGDGVHIKVAAKATPKALHLVHISASGDVAQSSYPRVFVHIDTGAEVEIIESFVSKPGAPELTTAVAEVHLQANAGLSHLRIVEGREGSNHIGSLRVRQHRDSRYTSRSVVMGGDLVRLEIETHFAGPGAECKLDGVYHAIGTEHVAHDTTIVHGASHCHSSEEYKGLIDDRAHAVFDGKIIVNRDTKGTSAHQQNHNLLLSDAATINTKPHLEIDSDDLAASHGATIGALDENQLFFLRARGIDEAQARSILTYSFVRAILDRIAEPAIRSRLAKKLLARLPHGEELEELAE